MMATKRIEDLRQETLRRLEVLRTERASHIPVWRDIKNHILPAAGSFDGKRQEKDGRRRDTRILDSTPTRALRICAAGMLNGMSGPSKPWFAMRAQDPDLNKRKAVQQWLTDVTAIMHRVFAKSNTYRSLHSMYEELAAFGTSLTIVVPSYRNVIHLHTQTAGTYMLTTDHERNVSGMFREFTLTAENIARQFGLDSVSKAVRSALEKGHYDQQFDVVHRITPRAPDERGRPGALGAEFQEVYVELSGRADTVLWESGHRYLPILAPRWIVTGEGVYGTSPGRDAIGPVLDLNVKAMRKAQAIDYATNPPLQGPTSLKYQQSDLLPGGMTYVDAANQNGGIRTAFEVNLNLQALAADIADTRKQVNDAFFADLFFMLINDERSGTTAREIAERHNEKMAVMGPVIERQQNEIYAPLIDITFNRLMEAGALPPPPEELQESQLDVEYTSILAQALRMTQATSIDRWVGTVSSFASVRPEAIDKLNVDVIVSRYAEILGVDPDLALSDEEVAAIRQARAQAAQQQAEQAAQQQAAQTAVDMAQAGATAAATPAGVDVAGALSTSQGLLQ